MPRQNAITDGAHPVDLHVGRQIAEARRRLGYNQSDLGRAIGVTFQQVQKYERGTNRVSASKLLQIARFLRQPVATFFPGDSDVEQSAEGPTPTSREALEIGRLAPTLDPVDQKTVLALMRSLTGRG